MIVSTVRGQVRTTTTSAGPLTNWLLSQEQVNVPVANLYVGLVIGIVFCGVDIAMVVASINGVAERSQIASSGVKANATVTKMAEDFGRQGPTGTR